MAIPRSASAATMSPARSPSGLALRQQGYSNPEIDKLFADGAVAFPMRREEIYAKAQKILVEDVPVAWMLELQFPTITRCSVKNLVTTASA